MDNKKLFVIIGVLASLLILETGYLIGKDRNIDINEAKIKNANDPRGLFNTTKPVDKTRRSIPVARAGSGDWENWNPFAEMHQMQTMMNRIFNNSFSRAHRMNIFDDAGILGTSFDPDIDIREKDDSYVLVVDLPGLDKDSININVNHNSITISGERVTEHEEKDEGKGFYRAERSFGSFSRTIPFDHRIIPGKVEAETTEGVLVVKIPKDNAEYDDKETKVTVQ